LRILFPKVDGYRVEVPEKALHFDLPGKVQMIYLDPPYGIKFGSNWQVSARKRDVKDGKLEDIAPEAEQIKAFRDT